MALPSAPASDMRRYWTEANLARDQGRIAHALQLYAKATALMPVPSEASYEAAKFALEVNGNLAGLDDLYDRHRRHFGLSIEACQRPILEMLLGQDGSEFVIDRLTQANTAPDAPVEWHETLADALASRGQLRQALVWRRLAHRRDPQRRANCLADPFLHKRQESPVTLVSAAALERAHVREIWAADGMLAALPLYSGPLRPYHVGNVPLQYEIQGDYKVLHHAGCFYAVPRRVSEFTIIDGRVYRLKGRARSSGQHLPPWLVDLAYRLVAVWRSAGQRVPLVRIVARPLVRLARFAGSTWLRPIAGHAAKLSWRIYGVKGVLTASTSRELLVLIDRHRRDH